MAEVIIKEWELFAQSQIAQPLMTFLEAVCLIPMIDPGNSGNGSQVS
jgi:hypothetical protein